MSRIRSLKPEFFVSEQVVECSTNARLLFIGLWCFCDDAGIHPASTKRLKMEVFPADAFTDDDVQQWMNELNRAGLIETYQVEDADYWRVTGWSRHQKIDRPTYRYPQPDTVKIGDASPNNQRALDEHSASPRDGVESNGVESKGSKPVSDDTGSPQPAADDQNAASQSKDQDRLPACPHQEIIKLYGKHLPTLPQPRAWEGQRANNLKARWRWVLTAKNRKGDRYATDAAGALAFFDRFFSYVADSDFLTGRDGKWPGCDLAWLVKAENFAKVIEGKYQNREAA